MMRTSPNIEQLFIQHGGFREAIAELRRLRHRARARPIAVALLAIAATSGAIAEQAVKRNLYDASVTFRVVERVESLSEGAHPQTNRKLREYIRDGVFTRKRRAELVDRYGLQSTLRTIDRNTAIDRLQDQIRVEVFRNDFLREDVAESAFRSARIRIGFSHPDPRIAEAVVRDLGQFIRDQETALREDVARRAAQQALRVQQDEHARMDQLRARLAVVRWELARSTGDQLAALQVETGQLRAAIAAGQDRLAAALRRREATELRQGLEQKQLLLRLVLTDWSRSPAPVLPTWARLCVVGIVAFVIFLPVSSIAVAAFDPKIYHEEDVRRLGLRSLGHIPSFSGDAAATFAQRRHARGTSAHEPRPG